MDYFNLTDDHKALYSASAKAFTLENEGMYEDAIEAHKNAILLLRTFIDDKIKDKMAMLHLLMFKAQVVVHQERAKYLDNLAAKGSFEGVVIAPTAVDDELKAEDGQHRSLSIVCCVFL